MKFLVRESGKIADIHYGQIQDGGRRENWQKF